MDRAFACLPMGMIVGMQILGLGAAWLARRSEGSSHQRWCQYLFLATLILMGGATLLATRVGPGCWLASGATFSLMVVGATCDFSRDADRREQAEASCGI